MIFFNGGTDQTEWHGMRCRASQDPKWQTIVRGPPNSSDWADNLELPRGSTHRLWQCSASPVHSGETVRTLLDLSVIAFRVSGNGVTHYWVEAIYTLTTLLGTGRALGILMRSHSLHSLDHYLLSTYSVQCMVPGALIQQWIVVILMLLIF